jgi:hypothetical protein
MILNNKFIIKHSTVAGKKPEPSDLALGEIALNTEDGVLYFKNKSGEIKEIRTFDHPQNNVPKPRSIISKLITIVYLLLVAILFSVLSFMVKVILLLFFPT